MSRLSALPALLALLLLGCVQGEVPATQIFVSVYASNTMRAMLTRIVAIRLDAKWMPAGEPLSFEMTGPETRLPFSFIARPRDDDQLRLVLYGIATSSDGVESTIVKEFAWAEFRAHKAMQLRVHLSELCTPLVECLSGEHCAADGTSKRACTSVPLAVLTEVHEGDGNEWPLLPGDVHSAGSREQADSSQSGTSLPDAGELVALDAEPQATLDAGAQPQDASTRDGGDPRSDEPDEAGDDSPSTSDASVNTDALPPAPTAPPPSSPMCVEGFATQGDIQNCGKCGLECSNNRIDGAPTCINGACGGVCKKGYDDCNGSAKNDGCETDLLNDGLHCGSCAHRCPYGSCASGACEQSLAGWREGTSIQQFAGNRLYGAQWITTETALMAGVGLRVHPDFTKPTASFRVAVYTDVNGVPGERIADLGPVKFGAIASRDPAVVSEYGGLELLVEPKVRIAGAEFYWTFIIADSDFALWTLPSPAIWQVGEKSVSFSTLAEMPVRVADLSPLRTEELSVGDLYVVLVPR